MKTSFIQRVLFVALLIVVPSAVAQTNALPASPTLPDASVSLLRVMGSLALVIGLFLGGVWLFKNWRRLTPTGGRQPKLNIFETRSLGGRQAVVVIGYEKQRFLISTSPNGVNLLTHLPDAAETEADTTDKTPATRPFAQALADVLKKK